jgi:hypothetical protein
MLGTEKTSRSHTGAQYIVKIFLCQPFVKELAKKEPRPLHLFGSIV